MPTTANAQAQVTRADRDTWLERPWELRYILYLSDDWTREKEFALRRTATAPQSNLDRNWKVLFESSAFFQSRDKWAKPGDGLRVVLIEFARDGTVKTPTSFGAPLKGRIKSLSTDLYVSLAAGDYATEPRFDLGFWFMGLGDISTDWAPGLCGLKNMPSPFSKTDTSYLYGPVFAVAPPIPTFGCREWAFQLGDPGRPYIDITSYYPKKADPDGPGTYVFQTLGWARFSDDPKPVIGKHEDDWFCLHECPGGEPPGRIDDIKAWAAKHGWPVPKRPTRIPVFPDPPGKQGAYPK